MITPPPAAATVAQAFAALPQVTAVALAGSLVAGADDHRSDLDLYVYSSDAVALSDRRSIAKRLGIAVEVGNEFWEPGDEWIDAATGIHVDVMYRSPAWIEEQLDRSLLHHAASVGYSTCFWHNVRHSSALFDRAGWYARLQERAALSYPPALKRAIVAKNHPILRRTHAAYRHQIEVAVARADAVAVQHRVTALLASYFDILFALNELPHPGEKRLLAYATTNCPTRPPNLEHDVLALFAATAPPAASIIARVDDLVDGLDALLVAEGLDIAAS